MAQRKRGWLEDCEKSQIAELLKDDRLRNWTPRICQVCGKQLPKGAKRRTCGMGTDCYSQHQSQRQGLRWRITKKPIPKHLLKYPDPKLAQFVIAYSDVWPGTGTCWQASAGIGGSGRGGRPMITYGGVRTTLQRASWMAFVGSIGDEEVILSICDNPMCVCPDHLYKGTQADKRQARLERGRELGRNVTESEAEEIRRLYFFTSISQKELAAAFGVSISNISNIVNFKGRWANRIPSNEEKKALVKKRRRLAGHSKRKLTDVQVREIRNSGEYQRVLGKRYGLEQGNISAIKLRKTYRDVD